MTLMLLGVGAGDQNVVNVNEEKIVRQTSSMNLWNACAAFLRPNGIRRNSNRPNGVMTAVFGTSSGVTGIYRIQGRSLRRSSYLSAVWQSRGCGVQDTCHVSWHCLTVGNHYTGTKHRESSFPPCGVVKPMRWRSDEQFPVSPFQQTPVEQWPTSQVTSGML